jgi:hypothetical protein
MTCIIFYCVTTFIAALVSCPFCRLVPAKDQEIVERKEWDRNQTRDLRCTLSHFSFPNFS